MFDSDLIFEEIFNLDFETCERHFIMSMVAVFFINHKLITGGLLGEMVNYPQQNLQK